MTCIMGASLAGSRSCLRIVLLVHFHVACLQGFRSSPPIGRQPQKGEGQLFGALGRLRSSTTFRGVQPHAIARACAAHRFLFGSMSVIGFVAGCETRSGRSVRAWAGIGAASFSVHRLAQSRLRHCLDETKVPLGTGRTVADLPRPHGSRCIRHRENAFASEGGGRACPEHCFLRTLCHGLFGDRVLAARWDRRVRELLVGPDSPSDRHRWGLDRGPDASVVRRDLDRRHGFQVWRPSGLCRGMLLV